MKKRFLAAPLCVLLSACAATPAGQLRDTDFVSRTVDTPSAVQTSVSAFYEGMRYCGSNYGNPFLYTYVTNGVAECGPSRPDGSSTCDVYLAGDKSYVLGRVDFAPVPNGSNATLRVQTKYAGSADLLFAGWELMIRGKAKNACPTK